MSGEAAKRAEGEPTADHSKAERRPRPRSFAEDWSFRGTPRPPTTVANPLGTISRPAGPASAGRVDTRGGLDLSPDGAEVAFSWDRSGAFEICTAPLFGDRIIQLTGAGDRSTAPRWSPDGRWVAFLRVKDAGSSQIFVVDRDGRQERALTHDEASHLDIAWSPYGRSLAYVADPHGRPFSLYVLDVASGEHRRLSDGQAAASRPRWSPDGSWLMFTAGDPTSDLFVVPAAGGEARRLDTRGALAGGSSQGEWSPDGSAFAFTTTVRGRSEVAFGHLRDGAVVRVERLGATPYEDSDPAWRPDGRAVLYRHAIGADVSVRRVFTVSHADEAIMDLPGVFHSPRVGPDCETTVAIFAESGRPAVVVVRPGNSPETRRIT